MKAACQFCNFWSAFAHPTSISHTHSHSNGFQSLAAPASSSWGDGNPEEATRQWSFRGDVNSPKRCGLRIVTAVKVSIRVESSKYGVYGARKDRFCVAAGSLGDPESDTEGSFHDDNGVAASLSSLPPDVTNSIESDSIASSCIPSSHATTGNSRVGLFRTPITGGVQSATSSHGLPHPAKAVRNLIEQARFAHLCTIMSRLHHRRRGYPFGTLVDFAADASGHPIFSMSPLAIHTRNLLADPRCTLVVQVPGWSGLANARVTLFGDVYPLSNDKQEWAHKHYTAKLQHCASQQWGNFHYYRMDLISDIYFVGGFGTVAWVDVKEYEHAQPDVIAANGAEETLKEMNNIFSRPLRDMFSGETKADDAALISIDSKGIDIRVREGAKFNVQRVSFEEGCLVETLDQAITALWKVLDKGPRLFPHQV